MPPIIRMIIEADLQTGQARVVREGYQQGDQNADYLLLGRAREIVMVQVLQHHFGLEAKNAPRIVQPRPGMDDGALRRGPPTQ